MGDPIGKSQATNYALLYQNQNSAKFLQGLPLVGTGSIIDKSNKPFENKSQYSAERLRVMLRKFPELNLNLKDLITTSEFKN